VVRPNLVDALMSVSLSQADIFASRLLSYALELPLSGHCARLLLLPVVILHQSQVEI